MQPGQDFLISVFHLVDSRDEELGLDVAEGLEDVPTMTQFDVCILHNTFCQYGFLADQGNSDLGLETAIGDMLDTVQGLDGEVLDLVGGDNSLHCGGETLEDEGEDGDLDGVPGSNRVGVLSPGSAALVYECEGCHHFGEALIVF